MTKLVIIGLGAAGFAAALSARKVDRSIDITIIDSKDYDLMHPCGLPFAIDGEVKLEELKHKINSEAMKLKLINKSKVTDIDTKDKTLTYQKGNQENTLTYDKLIIATGSSPIKPKIEGIEDNDNLFTIHTPEDVRKLITTTKKIKKANIIGAGAIGLETAIALNNKDVEVTITEALSSILPKSLDKDISEIIENSLKEKKIKLNLNKKIDKINKDEITILATGVSSNKNLAEKANIKLGKFGIKVNEKLETSVKDVYAVGDCIETINLITKKPWPSLIASSAYKQGTIAGANAAGSSQSYSGTLTTFATVLDKIEIASTGLNSHFAKKEGFDIISAKAKSKSKPEWFPNNKEITLKIIVDKKTKKILGAQAVGDKAAEKINLISAAISSNQTIQDLSNVELAYCPAVSQTYDIITMVADLILRKL